MDGAALAAGQAEPTDQERDAAADAGGFHPGWFLCGPPPVHHLAKAREVCHRQLPGCRNPAVALRSSCTARCVSNKRSRGLASASRAMWDLGQIACQAKTTNPAQQAGESNE